MKYDAANDALFKKLFELSNALLDKYLSERPGFDSTDEVPAAEIALIGGQLSPKGFAEVGGVKKAEHLHAEGIARDEYKDDPKQFEKRRVQEQIIAALDNKDRARLFSLVESNPELRLFAENFKRKKGQQKDRAGDYSDVMKALLDYLIREADLLWRLWKQHAISVGDAKNTAVRIVAKREAKLLGFNERALERQINSRRRGRKSS